MSAINLTIIPTHDLESYLKRCELHNMFPEHYEQVKAELKRRELK